MPQQESNPNSAVKWLVRGGEAGRGGKVLHASAQVRVSRWPDRTKTAVSFDLTNLNLLEGFIFPVGPTR